MVHQAEFLDAQLQDCRHLWRFFFVGVLHINSDEARIQATALHPEPAHHLVGLVWYAVADDLQHLLAVELNPFERSGVLALLAEDVNVDEVAALVRCLAMVTLGGRFLRHRLPPTTVGLGERSFWFVCSGDGSSNGGSVNDAEMEHNGVFCSASTGVCGRRFIRGVCVVVVGVAVCSASWQPSSGWRGWWPGRTNRPRQKKITTALISLVKLYLQSAKSHLHVSAVVMNGIFALFR